MQVGAECSASDVAFPGTAAELSRFGCNSRGFSPPGVWRCLGAPQAPVGQGEGLCPQRCCGGCGAGREGCRSPRLPHSSVGKGMIWGTIPAPSVLQPGRVCSSTAADAAQLSRSGQDPGAVTPQDTEGRSSPCCCIPVQGPASPARTRSSPELRHSLSLSPSSPRASPGTALNPGAAERRQRGVEGQSEVTPVPTQLSPCPGSLAWPLRPGASLLHAQLQADGKEFPHVPCWEEGNAPGTAQVEILTEGGTLTHRLPQL